jgi:hypothetical protein
MSFSLDEPAFAAWLNAYKSAWETRDPARAAALFTPDATYHEMPFDPPIAGTEAIAAYWGNAVAGQKDVRFSHDILAVSGAEGICHWHCAFVVVQSGDVIELDGIFHCRFADARQVAAFREWWHVHAGATVSDTTAV